MPPGAVAVVADAPPGLGTVTKAELDQEILQQASFTGSKKPPRPGSDEYEQLLEQGLSGLIVGIWLQGEGEEMGIEVTDKQIAEKLKEGEEEGSLREAGYTQKTIDERVTKEILVTEIEEALAEEARQQAGPGLSKEQLGLKEQEAFHEFDLAFKEQWLPRTHCADGYVTSQCGNYPPFAHSSFTPTPCYEAEPKEPPAEGCPAPVPPTTPAMPGSVTVLKPQGEPRAQRPFPEVLPEAESAGG